MVLEEQVCVCGPLLELERASLYYLRMIVLEKGRLWHWSCDSATKSHQFWLSGSVQDTECLTHLVIVLERASFYHWICDGVQKT
jgi:hypothetical protein